MDMIKLVVRELRKEETSAIEHFKYYTDNKESFVCIGDNVIVPVSNNNSGNMKKMLSEAQETMNMTLNSHPDFEYYTMDDGHFMVMMSEGPVAISPKKYDEYDLSGDNAEMALALCFRNECLEACEKAEIIAVVDIKEGK